MTSWYILFISNKCILLATTFSLQNHLKASPLCRNVPYIHFDYHTECRGNNTKNLDKLFAKMKADLDEFGVFHFDGSSVTE